MFGIEWALLGSKVGGFFKDLFSSKWFWIVVGSGLLAFGAYKVASNYVDNKVETAVTDDRKDTTIQTYQAKDQVDSAVAPIDRQHDQIRTNTIKEYHYVRDQIAAAPAEQREAPAPDLIIDTLNALGGMRRGAPVADGVPQASGPVG